MRDNVRLNLYRHANGFEQIFVNGLAGQGRRKIWFEDRFGQTGMKSKPPLDEREADDVRQRVLRRTGVATLSWGELLPCTEQAMTSNVSSPPLDLPLFAAAARRVDGPLHLLAARSLPREFGTALRARPELFVEEIDAGLSTVVVPGRIEIAVAVRVPDRDAFGDEAVPARAVVLIGVEASSAFPFSLAMAGKGVPCVSVRDVAEAVLAVVDLAASHAGAPAAIRRRRDPSTSGAGVLASVPGLDLPTAEGLMRRFGDVSRVAAANEDELMAVPGVGPVRAKALVAALRASPDEAVFSAEVEDEPGWGDVLARALTASTKEDLRDAARDAGRVLGTLLDGRSAIEVARLSATWAEMPGSGRELGLIERAAAGRAREGDGGSGEILRAFSVKATLVAMRLIQARHVDVVSRKAFGVTGGWPAVRERVRDLYALMTDPDRYSVLGNALPKDTEKALSRVIAVPRAAKTILMPGLDPRGRRQAPYAGLRRFEGGADDLRGLGIASVDALVAEANVVRRRGGKAAVGRADFPRSRDAFDALVREVRAGREAA